MGYRDFITKYADYILSLEDSMTDCNGTHEKMTAVEWRDAIDKENEDHARDIKRGFYDSDNMPHIFTFEEITWIIESLEENGFVKTGEEALWYVPYSGENDGCHVDWGNGYYDLEDAKRELEKLYTEGYENAHIAVIDMSGNEAMCIAELSIEDI